MCGTWTHLSDSIRKARKDYRCEAGCRVPIPAGFSYIAVAGVNDGKFEAAKWHLECLGAFEKMLRENGDDCGDPWDTWENGMPPEIWQRYVQGPIEEEQP